MEHIIQFAVSVDDDRIMKLAERAAADELVKQFKSRDARVGYYAGDAWKSRVFDAVTRDLVREISGTQVNEMAQTVADKLFRSQKFREKVADALAERGQ